MPTHSVPLAHWYCPNHNCKWSMVATIALPGEDAPQCVCGELMRHTYPEPVFHYLDFLRPAPPGGGAAEAEE